jgi:hypothetical protein
MKTIHWMALLIVILTTIAGREMSKNRELIAMTKVLEKHQLEQMDTELKNGFEWVKKMKLLEERLTADEQSFSGHPAPESQLVVGKYYQCDSLTADEWPDRTEKYLVLQELVPNGKYWKMVKGNKRLYRTDMPAVQGLVYRFEKTNGTPTLRPAGAIPHESELAPLPKQPTPAVQ